MLCKNHANFQATLPSNNKYESQSLSSSYFLSHPPPFDFPPFPNRPFPPHLVHFHQSPVTFILWRTDPGAVRGRVKGVVVIEWVPGTGVRKDAGEIGRKRRKRRRRWQGKRSRGRRSKKGEYEREKGVVTATIGRERSNPREGSPSDILPHPQPSRALNHPL